ncbi:phosphatidylinositol 4-phosphate 5-kinase 7 isoform X2 [Amborella trichopoda]|uniref:Phosphatidylinositol 4-phosphate 5-kinase n=1 Tax=Amborella trichopoda TaxID=13333 RepID=W1NRF6_AMBTC|nr:phosphatidylinositol 4-phosphate 5-kinase 7 isoform X2 [Amborella trichopoda]ERM97605.1 hypothetical protein AMTR_s00173p00020990 [Amborella trichopoda]|eukprot:XP_006830189.1 phosphatidylinositol 4-phosphate 5-kinase 7 isoform X2 [Amborella trichopoda]
MTDSQRFSETVFSNGDIYEGSYKGQLPHGTGKYIWFDGCIYEGEWEESKMSGRGKISWPSGASYNGDFSGGYIHGSGTYIAADGASYMGDWRMNIQHGLGKKTYNNSDVYEGSWKEGVPEGIGRYLWSSGNTYVGSWKSGKMCGRGILKWVNGDLFDGFWVDGLEQGFGIYRFADGGYYFGTWSRGLKDGKGSFFPSGSKIPNVASWLTSFNHADCKSYFHDCSASMDLEDFSAQKLRKVKSSLSEKWSVIDLFKSTGRISHRSTSLDGDLRLGANVGEISRKDVLGKGLCALEGGTIGTDDDDVTVYDREYIQGMLKSESIRSNQTSLKNNRKRHKRQTKEGNRPGETVIKGHRSYYLMLSLQLGIRYTVGKITPVPMREVRSSDFGPRARIRMYFPREGSQFTPPHYSIDFYWKDYCPMVFRNLREMFKIDAADYMISICGGDGLRELSSPGKSGSIFYLSQDERFVIKTLRKSEVKALLKMLPNYYNHVGMHENTLITKFFGLHRITLRGGRKVRFVVMGNMFRTELRIHRRYDLKGSLQGRFTKKRAIDENTTLKDLDLAYVFQLEPSWRESLFKQISLDCKFLESQCIIDYSLLLGLHFRAPEHLIVLEPQDTIPYHVTAPPDDVNVCHEGELPIPPRGLLLVAHEPNAVSTTPGSHIRGSTLRAPAVGDEEVDLLLPGMGRLRVQLGVNMPARANRKLQHDAEGSLEMDLFEVYDVVLYLGIIDILQEYNLKKKLEHAYKSLQFDPLSISAVEPKLYSERFLNFLKKVFPEQT